jgi:amino acid transporter
LFIPPGPAKKTDGLTFNRHSFLAFFSTFITSAFSFIGTEIVAVTVGEARNPRRAVPRAIRRVFFRIVTFYILGIFVISLIVPYNDPRLLSDTGNAASSPFTIAVSNAGIKVLPSIVNAIVLVAAWSAANSDVVSRHSSPIPLSLIAVC